MVILVDEVLYTTRTIRAAIGHVMALARPRLIKLAVLVDRGGHELPIQADYCGVHLEVGVADTVEVVYEGSENDGIYSKISSQKEA